MLTTSCQYTEFMYFKSRAEAGQKLATELAPYRYENTAILALSEGGVLVGEQIARSLHSTLSLLLTAPIDLVDLGGSTIGVIDPAGTFTYNQMIPAGILEEAKSEMRGTIEEEKMKKLYQLSRALGDQGFMDKRLFYGRNVIIVSDGLKGGLALDAAINFLKPIRVAKLIGAVPLASVGAVDRLHILCDEIYVLNVIDSPFDINHYYEDNQIGDTQAIMNSINQVIKSWQ